MKRYGLISDTHGWLHPDVFRVFTGVEAIFHAGDVCDETILDDLQAIAPTYAVCGNCDEYSPRLPPLTHVDAAFGRVIITHSHLYERQGRDPEALARHFASAKPRLILFGHTHQALEEYFDGIWVVNPGSAGRPRFRDIPSVKICHWDPEKDLLWFELFVLNWDSRSGR